MMASALLGLASLLVVADVQVTVPPNDDGTHLQITASAMSTPAWLVRQPAGGAPPRFARGYPGVPARLTAWLDLAALPTQPAAYQVGAKVGAWTVVAPTIPQEALTVVDAVTPGLPQQYAVVAPATGEVLMLAAPMTAAPAWLHRGRLGILALIVLTGASLFGFSALAKRRTMFIRRIAGIDAIEDAIGRSTEMGRPVLYVTGVDEAQDIQTIAGLIILSHVAKVVATYDTELRVANAFPLTMVIAEEMVRQGYANAGRPDAHRPEHVQFISSEQFAFAAGVNGMILRDRPAANLYFGRFFAESLMLAETGFMAGAVQIAGTAELTQLPFFVAACDHTLMGEELFATSAYMTRTPDQMGQLKSGDFMKALVLALVLLGAAAATWGWDFLPGVFS